MIHPHRVAALGHAYGVFHCNEEGTLHCECLSLHPPTDHYPCRAFSSSPPAYSHPSVTNTHRRCGHVGSGAGEGNRTLVVSLGSFCSAIELHPRCHAAFYAARIACVTHWCVHDPPTPARYGSMLPPRLPDPLVGGNVQADARGPVRCNGRVRKNPWNLFG